MAFSQNQFAYVDGTSEYRYGHKSIPEIKVSDAPIDCDYSRTAMLHGDANYRFYCFKSGTNDTLYQFAWNGSSYAFGASGSIPELKITGIPADANTQFFAMLHDGNDYRLYFAQKGQPALYQFAWNGSSYAFGHKSIPNLKLEQFPEDADLDRFGMMFDKSDYRFYALSKSDTTKVYQGAWAGGSSYVYGHKSIKELKVTGAPKNTAFNDVNMLYDGSTYRMYFPTSKPNQFQFAYDSGNVYRFGHNSIPCVKSSGFPVDADFTRTAMLFDGSSYRLYCMKAGTIDTIYQGAWNNSVYEFGHNSIREIKITGMPEDVDGSNFGMLHDGGAYRLYMRRSGQNEIYQCSWDGSTYKYGHNSIPKMPLIGFPDDADLSRFDLLHDKSAYRYYAMSRTNASKVYQGAFNPGKNGYEFGHKSIPELELQGTPPGTEPIDINMLHDGANYRLYIPTASEEGASIVLM